MKFNYDVTWNPRISGFFGTPKLSIRQNHRFCLTTIQRRDLLLISFTQIWLKSFSCRNSLKLWWSGGEYLTFPYLIWAIFCCKCMTKWGCCSCFVSSVLSPFDSSVRVSSALAVLFRNIRFRNELLRESPVCGSRSATRLLIRLAREKHIHGYVVTAMDSHG